MTPTERELRERLERVEAELRLARGFLDQTGEVARIGGWELNLLTGERHWSRTIFLLYGFNPDGPLPPPEAVWKQIAKEDHPLVERCSMELHSKGTPFAIEARVLPVNGQEPRWTRMEGRAEMVDGRVTKIYGTVQDIHARKLAALAEQAREKKLQFILSQFKVGVWELDVPTGTLHWDDSMYPLFDVEPGTPPWEAWQARVLPDELQPLHADFLESLERRAPFDRTLHIRRRDGSVRHLSAQSELHCAPDGTPLRALGINHDVTDARDARRRTLMLENLADLTPDIFGICAADGTVIYLNQAARRLGWREDAHALTFFPEESVTQFQDKVWPVLRAGRVWEGEMPFLDLTVGSAFPVHQRSFLLRDGHGQPVVATIATDLRERKHLESQIERQRLQFIQNSRMSSLGQMAAGMAHEINNPLTILKGHATILQMEMARGPEMNAEIVGRTLRTLDGTVDRIARIIHGLRNFARDGSRDPMADFPLRQLVEGTLSFCRSRFENHGLRVSVDQLPDTLIHGQQVQLQQALLNLLNNAFDAARDSQGRWVRVGATLTGWGVRLEVSDSGEGVPLHDRERIMEPFFTTKPVGQGTGLGLSISKGIMEAHGARIYLDESAPHTTFVMHFPQRGGQ